MDMKYGVMIFNQNEIYKDFYVELYKRLSKINNQDFYFTIDNPENDKFNYDNVVYVCINSESIESDNILSHFTFTLDVLADDFSLVDITKEYAESEEYKDLVFEFNFVFMFKNKIINRTYYYIDNADLLDNDSEAINIYINGNENSASNYGILIISADNDIWEVKKLLINFLPIMGDHVNFNDKNPVSKLLRYRFDNILYATSDYDDIFKHTCFLIEHICSKIFNEYPYLPANPIKDNEYSHVRISFITYDGIYNKEIYTKLDWDRFNNDGWNKDKTYKKILCERNLL